MRRRNRLPLATLESGGRPKRRGRRWGRRLLLVIVLGGAVGGGWWWWKNRHAAEVIPPELAPVAALEEEAGLVPASAEPAGGINFAIPRLPATPQPSAAESESSLSEVAAPARVEPPPTPPPAAPPLEKNFQPRAPSDIFEAQIALTRDAICPGSIDGAWGGQTRAAVAAYQQKHGLRITGQLDIQTKQQLQLREPPLKTYTITPDDHLRLRPQPKGWLERSALDRLDFTTILEMVAERHWTHPNQIKKLNPKVNWEQVPAGTVLVVPNVRRANPRTRPAAIVIHLGTKTLQLLDGESRLLAHFPCSIARRVEKRPVGDLTIEAVAPNPDYWFDPANFPDSPEAQRVGQRLRLQPGPNNPVGTAWIDLSLDTYGIHGSPEPEQIGRTESSGCFRLANWNASYLVGLVHPGMAVRVEE